MDIVGICEEWLYFKLYGGAILLEDLLLRKIWPLLSAYVYKEEISALFFVRYADPEYHLRIRFKCPTLDIFINLIREVDGLLKPYVKTSLIKVKVACYEREINRYSCYPMDVVEELFAVSSSSIINCLVKASRESEYLFIGGLLGIWTFEAFNIDSNIAQSLSKKWSSNMLEDLNCNKNFSRAINKEFHKYKRSLELATNQKFEDFETLNASWISEIYELYIEQIQSTLGELKQRKNGIESFISSFLHMTYNRLFMGNSRILEAVVYTFLSKLYAGINARANAETP